MAALTLAPVLAAGWLGGANAAQAPSGPDWSESGRASYYGSDWNGRRTASGERFDSRALTAAHAWLPFGTRVRVLAEATGREVIVTVTDRIGTARRVIDLSQQAARVLGILRQGVAEVTLEPE